MAPQETFDQSHIGGPGENCLYQQKSPERIRDREASEVLKTITPGLATELVSKEKAVAVTTRADAITIANINTNALEDGGRAREGQSRGTTLHVDNVANQDGRLKMFRQANAISHCGKYGIITKFALPKCF